jgi:CRISPR-associated protein Cas2
MSDKHWYLVSYDIRNDRRWRQAYKQLQGRGKRIHYSLFRCRLGKTEMESLRWELEKILSSEDDLMLIPLCPRCACKIEERGTTNDWGPPASRHEIL